MLMGTLNYFRAVFMSSLVSFIMVVDAEFSAALKWPQFEYRMDG